MDQDLAAQAPAIGGWLNETIRLLVDEPEAVRITSHEGRQVVVFEVAVAPGDFRRVVGRRGSTADALRQILSKVAGRTHRRFLLELLEPEAPHPAS